MDQLPVHERKLPEDFTRDIEHRWEDSYQRADLYWVLRPTYYQIHQNFLKEVTAGIWIMSGLIKVKQKSGFLKII